MFNLFAQNLKRLRNDAKLTQQELATKLKVAPSTIAMYESNKRMPDAELLNRIANIFNVSIDYLLGRTNVPTASELLPFDEELMEFFGDVLPNKDQLSLLSLLPQELRLKLYHKTLNQVTFDEKNNTLYIDPRLSNELDCKLNELERIASTLPIKHISLLIKLAKALKGD